MPAAAAADAAADVAGLADATDAGSLHCAIMGDNVLTRGDVARNVLLQQK